MTVRSSTCLRREALLEGAQRRLSGGDGEEVSRDWIEKEGASDEAAGHTAGRRPPS